MHNIHNALRLLLWNAPLVPRAVWTRLLPPRPSSLSVNQTQILKRDARRAAVAPSHRLVWLGWREPCTLAAAVVLLPLASCLPAPCQCLSAAYTLSACHTPDGCLVLLLNKHLCRTGRCGAQTESFHRDLQEGYVFRLLSSGELKWLPLKKKTSSAAVFAAFLYQ